MRLIKADKKVTISSFNLKDGVTEQTISIIDFLLRYTKEGLIGSEVLRLPDIINNVNLEAYTAGWIDGRQDLLKEHIERSVENENIAKGQSPDKTV